MAAEAGSGNRSGTFFCIPHNHWEGAVFKTRAEYLDMGLPHILRALQLLKLYPHYRFTLDQTCYVQPFLERYPEQEGLFRQLLSEGRLAIVGGTIVMPDVNMPGGESFIRQMLYGKGYLRRYLGLDVTVAWQLDTFGHHAQMPQLLRLAGYESFWFVRGVPDWDMPMEFSWQGLDGTTIPAFWLAPGYSSLYLSPRTLPEFTDFMAQRYAALTPFTQRLERVGIAAWDVREPEGHLPVLAEEFNRCAEKPFKLQFAVPSDFEVVSPKNPERPVIAGELNPIFQGTYSSRISLKQQTRELEALLTNVEKLGALLYGQGIATNEAQLELSWESFLFNQAHDLMSGVMTDHVYEDTLGSNDLARRLGEIELRDRLHQLIELIDTQGEGVPLIVFNTLGWTRNDVVEVRLGVSEPNIGCIDLRGPDGHPVPVQTVGISRCEDGALTEFQIAFIARDIPAMGYATYRVLFRQDETATPPMSEIQESTTLENEFYRVQVDAATGALTDLLVKDGNWKALNGPGNVVALQEDRGDFWELYRPLDGLSRIAMKERHEPPLPGEAVLSTDVSESKGQSVRGPVFSEFVTTLPFSNQGRLQTVVRLYNRLRRIEFQTRIRNHDKHVRYRLLFPTSLAAGKNIHEIPFGCIERPEGVEFPAQNWMDWSNEEKGVALLNRGLPGNNVSAGTLMLSLMRSTRIVEYDCQGGYDAGLSSDSGFELGQEMTFHYALVPHPGNWQQTTNWRDGQEYNNPLIARTAAPHVGVLPSKWGFLSISHANVVLSALKKGEDSGVVLRIYEASGQATVGVKIALECSVTSAEEINLMEDTVGTLPLHGNGVHINLRPFEIKTIGFHCCREGANATGFCMPRHE